MRWLILIFMAAAASPWQALADRAAACEMASRDLLAFAHVTSPDPNHPTDTSKSRYQSKPHHELIADALMAVERGDISRLIITMPPRHGKTELGVRKFVAWFMGRDPTRHAIVSTYSDTFAGDHGRDVRDVMQSPGYAQTFGRKAALRSDSQAMDRLRTESGGMAIFVGRGGSITGRGGHLIVIDDPIKDSEEARSKVIRDKLWDWFTETVVTRLMTDDGRIVVIQTRWHEDDLVGRLTDKRNPHYSEAEAGRWTVLHLPALAEDDDILGRAKGEPLWPERFSTRYLAEVRDINARAFSAIWQGRPTPEQGTHFTSDMIVTYQPHELPKYLRKYCASDHAVALNQENDLSCLLPAGVDTEGHIWVLPDVFWHRKNSKDIVDAMIQLIRTHRPIFWWAEAGHISKSIGPFLRDRMDEENVFAAVDEIIPVKDKVTRAQSIQGRMALHKVHFPAFAPWWPDALDQMLSFPHGTHDDFVDALAHLGMGLDRMAPADNEAKKRDEPKPGTLAWVKWSSKQQEREAEKRKDKYGY